MPYCKYLIQITNWWSSDGKLILRLWDRSSKGWFIVLANAFRALALSAYTLGCNEVSHVGACGRYVRRHLAGAQHQQATLHLTNDAFLLLLLVSLLLLLLLLPLTCCCHCYYYRAVVIVMRFLSITVTLIVTTIAIIDHDHCRCVVIMIANLRWLQLLKRLMRSSM